MNEYRDPRSEFWKRHFARSLSYADYLATSKPEYAAKWAAMDAKIPALLEVQAERLRGYHRQLLVLAYSGAWCGDCVRQGPMIERIAGASDDIIVRWIDRDASPELTEELRMAGGRRVPIFVLLSEDFFEVARHGDRTLTAYRAKAARDVGPTCDPGLIPPPSHQLDAEMEEWVAHFERALIVLRLSPFYRQRYGD